MHLLLVLGTEMLVQWRTGRRMWQVGGNEEQEVGTALLLQRTVVVVAVAACDCAVGLLRRRLEGLRTRCFPGTRAEQV